MTYICDQKTHEIELLRGLFHVLTRENSFRRFIETQAQAPYNLPYKFKVTSKVLRRKYYMHGIRGCEISSTNSQSPRKSYIECRNSRIFDLS